MIYFIGTILILFGFLVIWKSEAIYGWTGNIDLAEKYLGVGETRLFIKLFGLAIIMISFMLMTGVVQGILTALFVPKEQNF